MNYIKQIAEMLDVEIWEEFDVVNYNYAGEKIDNCPFSFCEYSLIDSNGKAQPRILGAILQGDYSIRKKIWKPNNGQKYYFISFTVEDNPIILETKWKSRNFDKLNYKNGNCFKTAEIAEKHINKLVNYLSEAEADDSWR